MREELDLPRVTKIIVEFEDGEKEEISGETLAFVVLSESRNELDGWMMYSTDEVSEDDVLGFSYDMVDNIENEKVQEAITEAKLKNKTHLTLVKS